MPTYISSTGGPWNFASSWSGGIPNGVDAVAIFPANPNPSPMRVSFTIPVTVGELTFATGTGPWEFWSMGDPRGAELTMEASDGLAEINLGTTTGPVRFELPTSSSAGLLFLASTTQITTTGVNSTLRIDWRIDGTAELRKAGTGTLQLSNAGNDWTGGLRIDGGSVSLLASNVLSTGTVTLGASGTLDLNGFDQSIRTLSGTGDVVLDGGDLTITGQTGNLAATFIGTAAAEELRITLGASTTFFSNAGASYSNWGSNDSITIIGNGLGNTIIGNSLNAARELIEGLGGNDDIDARSGADTLQGGFGQDRLIGGTGNDIIYGEDSASSLTPEDDTYVATSALDGVDLLHDVEILDYRAIGAANPIRAYDSLGGALLYIVDIAGGDLDWAQTGPQPGYSYSAIKAFLFGAGDDDLSAENLFFSGSPGTLGMLVDGGLGNDTIRKGGQDDTLDGGAGFDTAVLGFYSYVWNMATGAVNSTSSGSITFQAVNFEAAQMGSGSDSIAGNAANNLIVGNGGNDTLDGGAGSDTLSGGDNDDFIVYDAADLVANVTGGNRVDTLYIGSQSRAGRLQPCGAGLRAGAGPDQRYRGQQLEPDRHAL